MTWLLLKNAPNTVPRNPRRVANNIRTLGIFWIVYSALHFIPGAVLFSIPMGLPWINRHIDVEELFAGQSRLARRPITQAACGSSFVGAAQAASASHG